MIDGIFFINNALRVTQLSVYSEEQRYQQTLETIHSINQTCPNNRKFIFDSSPLEPKEDYIRGLSERGVTVFYMGQEPGVKALGEAGLRSLSETITFATFLDWYRKQNYAPSKRIYKLSGRYRFNEHFRLNDESHTGSFVFAKPHDSWMEAEDKIKSEVDKLYPLRLWHMDHDLLPAFQADLLVILDECAKHNIDVEHAYYKVLHKKYKVIELDKIGVCGNIAPNGEYIDE